MLADESRAHEFPSSATLLLDTEGLGGARALRSAIDWCQSEGHEAVVVALTTEGVALDSDAWTTLARTTRRPIAVLSGSGSVPALARIFGRSVANGPARPARSVR